MKHEILVFAIKAFVVILLAVIAIVILNWIDIVNLDFPTLRGWGQ